MKLSYTNERKDRTDCIRKLLNALYPKIQSPLYYTHDYEFLFAVILSAQTTDKQVNKVTETLCKKYPSLQSIADASVPSFQQDISSINLYKTKAKHIVQSAQIIIKNFKGKVPRTLAKLITLPGVGRKSANVVMSELWHMPEGIAVDTHVMRLSQKLGLTNQKDPVKIEQDLMQIVPKDKWYLFSLLLILHGREICTARPHTCENCPLQDLCPDKK